MTHRSLTAAAVSLATLPLAFGAVLWRRRAAREQFWIELDPFEVDLQLRERND